MKKDGDDGRKGRNGRNGRNEVDAPAEEPVAHPILPPRGDYASLLSYQKAEVVYDLTFRFAHRYFARGDRTIDQMIQAARSGKQNILWPAFLIPIVTALRGHSRNAGNAGFNGPRR